MFGCLRRLVVLVLLAVAGIAAWVTRDRWLPLVRGGGAPAADSTRRAAPPDTGWTRVTWSAAERGRGALAPLRRPKGPAYVRMAPSAFAGLVLDSLGARLPASADSLAVRAEGRELLLRMSVRLGDLGGRAVLGPLAAMLGDRERVVLGGTLEGAGEGRALLRPTRVTVGSFDVPGPVVPRLVDALARGARDSTARDERGALALPLPAGVGDVRVADDSITLYRPVP